MTLGSGEVWPHRHLLITERLKTRRDLLGLTQKQVVGRLAKLGVQTTNRTLSNLEHGAGVDVARLPELAIALECTVTYLMGLTQSPHHWNPDPVTDAPPLPFRPSNESKVSSYGAPAPPLDRTSTETSSAVMVNGDYRPENVHRTDRMNGSCLILGLEVPDRHVQVGGSTDSDTDA